MDILISYDDIDYIFVSYYIDPDTNHNYLRTEWGVTRCTFHSETGPAFKSRFSTENFFYLHGKRLTFEEWFERIPRENQLKVLYELDVYNEYKTSY